jgi:hypothetical protein
MWIAFGVGLAGIIAGIWLVMAMLPRWLGTQPNRSSTGGGASVADARKIRATLFYVAEDGSQLVPVSREVPLGATPGEQARRIIEAQLQPAPQGLHSPVPAGTQVHGVFLTAKADAFVDLNPAIMTGHTGGSLNETLTVFAIVNAITVNLPDVAGVQILIDGKEVDTLAGHIDLRHPLGRSLQWVRRQ